MKTTIYQYFASEDCDDAIHAAFVIPNSEKTVTEALALGRRALACTGHPNMRYALANDGDIHISLESVQEVDISPAELIAADKVLARVTNARHFVAESELPELEAELDDPRDDDDPIVEYDETPVRNDILVGLG